MTQAKALKLLKSGKNIFLTGSAGTGKTFLLNQFIDYLKKEKINVGITASTGIASTHLRGVTIHSWSGIGINDRMTDAEILKLVKKEELRKRIKETKVLIIDEISMLDACRVDLIDRICKAVKDPFKPFGGTQIVMCGDFFQLPPIGRGDVNIKFAYDAYVWSEADIQVCYLDTQYRQNDKVFVSILNSIRDNKVDDKVWEKLKTRFNIPVKSKIRPTNLYTHNINVDAINDRELKKIPGKEKSYYMNYDGPHDLVSALKKSCMSPDILVLKKGAIVMFVKNNFDMGYVNGTLGEVVDFDSDNGYPIVKIKDGEEIVIGSSVWEREEGGEVVAMIRQLPLRLAWAITVHKSQGMSLDCAEIDLSKSFECGMGYVALSRVRRLDGIKLMGINKMALQVNQKVLEKDREFRKLSE